MQFAVRPHLRSYFEEDHINPLSLRPERRIRDDSCADAKAICQGVLWLTRSFAPPSLLSNDPSVCE